MARTVGLDVRFWWRWLRGLLRFLVRRSPDRSLLRHEVQRLDPQSIRSAIDRGEPFALRLGERQCNLVVEPAPVADDGATVVVDGEDEAAAVPLVVETFAGRVDGEDDSDVRLTVTESAVLGYVRTRDGWWWIDPLRRLQPKANPAEHVVYRSDDTAFRVRFGRDDPEGRTVAPDDGDEEHRVNPHIGIAIWGDRSFRDQAQLVGMSWTTAQATLVNLVNGIYQARLGLQFVIRVFVLHVGNSLSSNKAEDLLDQFGVRVRAVHGDIRRLDVRQNTRIEVAHLLTGRNLDGSTIGVAWRPGVWGLAEHHHVPLGNWILQAIENNLVFKNTMVSAHELGHNFTGRHDLADEICVTHFIWCWDYERTIMWATFYSDNRDEFSRDNADGITDNAQNGRNVNFAHT